MFEPREIADGVTLRVLRPDDVPALAAAYARNREHLAPWEPVRRDEFFTEEWQSHDLARRLAAVEAGEGFPLGLFTDTALVGRFNLAGIVRGPFQSAGLGYWIDGACTGRGLATAAVRAMIAESRDGLGLHRIEASTLVHNVGSQRVLLKTGFQKIGMAPRYLQIAGEWQDHNLYQVILHD